MKKGERFRRRQVPSKPILIVLDYQILAALTAKTNTTSSEITQSIYGKYTEFNLTTVQRRVQKMLDVGMLLANSKYRDGLPTYKIFRFPNSY